MADNPPRSDAELLDLAYPCALDAVGEIERRRIEERLAAADPAVRQEFSDTVRRLREVMAQVAALDAQAPPPELEARILAALPDDGRARLPSAWQRRMRWVVPVAAAACLVIGGSVIADRIGSPPDGVPTAERIHRQPDSRTLTKPVAGGGTVMVEFSAQQRLAVVAFTGVAEPPSGRVYQVWLVPVGERPRPRSAGVLVELPSTAKPFVTTFDPGETLAVSVEPSGGSAAPTSPPIAGVPLV
ncbi:anti-sigma factor [Nocardia ninae]|uniref:Regulator of SigK n=1 Tax=Nocardia ninae NBRC 108245 TaxID=1210091 RepID=A0A511MIU6_9NOCA|nr:anti-sigma factor [Nocardia ninae]GEM40509.1 anti-sigma-K factor RskA [Nocardia ninae NBRC 108245]